MTQQELKQAAIECLAKAFRGDGVDPSVVQAALAIVLAQSQPPNDMSTRD